MPAFERNFETTYQLLCFNLQWLFGRYEDPCLCFFRRIMLPVQWVAVFGVTLSWAELVFGSGCLKNKKPFFKINVKSWSGFRILIRIRINLSCSIQIRIQIADPDPGGEKWPQKIEKRTEFSSFEVLDVHFWGLKASPVAWASFMEA
jgi:hypothetical protein